jgi:hypothetical protein
MVCPLLVYTGSFLSSSDDLDGVDMLKGGLANDIHDKL